MKSILRNSSIFRLSPKKRRSICELCENVLMVAPPTCFLFSRNYNKQLSHIWCACAKAHIFTLPTSVAGLFFFPCVRSMDCEEKQKSRCLLILLILMFFIHHRGGVGLKKRCRKCDLNIETNKVLSFRVW